MSGRRWTPEEIDLLEQHYGGQPVEAIARRLGRTEASVYVRAGKMRLGRQRPAGVLSLTELMVALGISHHAMVTRWIRDRKLVASRKPIAYGSAKRPEWWIHERDLAAFLAAYPHLVDRDGVDPAYRQFVPERWITFVQAFRRGAAWPFFLDTAVKAGLIPEARKRGEHGTRWAIPERILPALVEARQRMTSDAEHRRLVVAYDRLQRRGGLKRSTTRMNAAARAAADGGRSGRRRAERAAA